MSFSSPADQTRVKEKVHYPALDGVRGLAIIGVLLYHSCPDLSDHWRSLGIFLNRLASFGPFGVDLFFVLSGFLITGILLDTRGNKHYFKNFYARRVLRLFPVYYLYLALMMTVIPLLHRILHTSIAEYSGNWWWYLTYFCNWKSNFSWGDPGLGHIWSLAVEEQFYLIWPVVVLIAGRRYLAWVCAILIVQAIVLRCVWSAEGAPWNQIYRLTITRWDTMAMGALAALALRSDYFRPRVTRLAWPLMLGGVASFLSIAVMAGGAEWSRPPIQSYGASFASLGFVGLVLYGATRNSGLLYKWLCNGWLRSLGKYSYFIYVVHLLAISHVYYLGGFVAARVPQFAWLVKVGQFTSVNIGVYFLATLSWRYIEAPLLALKRRFDD
jgi:peptidoglycan/LPS O-acetylase OafA/YrhL